MTMKRKILTESQAREWFEKFGQELGQTFDDVFGEMDLSKNSQTATFKVVNRIMFLKIKNVSVGYLIIPQLDMYLQCMSKIRLGNKPESYFFIYKVWCDVLLWYYDTYDYYFYFRDIYNIPACWYESPFYPFRLESNYRYSGLLYDKLIHLLNYAYHDIMYYPVGETRDVLYYFTFRLLTNGQHNIIKETATNHLTPNYLKESVAQSLHFINT